MRGVVATQSDPTSVMRLVTFAGLLPELTSPMSSGHRLAYIFDIYMLLLLYSLFDIHRFTSNMSKKKYFSGSGFYLSFCSVQGLIKLWIVVKLHLHVRL